MSQELFASVDTSGLSDVDVQFKNVRFGVHPKATDRETGQQITVLLYDQLDENGQEREDQFLRIGNNFKPIEGGAAVEHTNSKYNKGAASGLGKNSAAATLLDSLVPLGFDQFKAKMEAGIGPRQAAFWEGISFHLMLEEREGWKVNIETGKKDTFNVTVASEFYGWDGFPGQGEQGNGGSEGRASNENRDLRSSAGSAPQVEIADEVAELLRPIAKQHPTFDSFVAAAYELDEIADENVSKVVDNEAAYDYLRATAE